MTRTRIVKDLGFGFFMRDKREEYSQIRRNLVPLVGLSESRMGDVENGRTGPPNGRQIVSWIEALGLPREDAIKAIKLAIVAGRCGFELEMSETSDPERIEAIYDLLLHWRELSKGQLSEIARVARDE